MATGRVVEEIKGKKYKVIIEAGKHPSTGARRRIIRRMECRKPEAEKLCADLIYQLETGTYIEPNNLTICDYLKHWLVTYGKPNLAPSTYASYNRIINSHIIPELGHLPISKITPIQIQAYYSNKLEGGRRDKQTGGLSARTVRYHHTVLREALQHAVKWQLLYRNPADATEPPRPEKPEISMLTPDDVKAIIDNAGDNREKWLIMFAAYTGMRQGELLALKWSAVDVDSKEPFARVLQSVGYINGQGHVFRPIGKNKKSLREVSLAKPAVHALRQQKKLQAADRLSMPPGKTYVDSGLIFTTKDGQVIDPSGLTRRFKKIAESAGLPKARFHDLRHSFATALLSQGVHPKVVQELLGHETITVTMDTYSHVIKGMQKDAVKKLNKYFVN